MDFGPGTVVKAVLGVETESVLEEERHRNRYGEERSGETINT